MMELPVPKSYRLLLVKLIYKVLPGYLYNINCRLARAASIVNVLARGQPLCASMQGWQF